MIKLVRTQLRRRILIHMITHGDTDCYVRELACLLREDPGNCSRELKRFEQAGIITSQTRGRAKFYILNHDYPALDTLKALLAKEEAPEEQRAQLLFLCESKLRRKLFGYVLRHKTKECYVRELADLIDEDPGNLSRELKVFEQAGIFESVTRANAKFYRLLQDHPLVDDLELFLFGQNLQGNE